MCVKKITVEGGNICYRNRYIHVENTQSDQLHVSYCKSVNLVSIQPVENLCKHEPALNVNPNQITIPPHSCGIQCIFCQQSFCQRVFQEQIEENYLKTVTTHATSVKFFIFFKYGQQNTFPNHKDVKDFVVSRSF